jgi:hypothetical protein
VAIRTGLLTAGLLGSGIGRLVATAASPAAAPSPFNGILRNRICEEYGRYDGVL